MDYKAEIERTKAVFDMLLPYVQCDKDEFMATASADAKLAMLLNGWANPWQACHELSNYAYWCARKGKIRSKAVTKMDREITSAMARRKEDDDILKDLKKVLEEIESKVGAPADRIRVALEPGAEENTVFGVFIKTDENGRCPDLHDGAYLLVYSNGYPWDVTIYHPKTEESRTYNFSTRRGSECILHEDGTIEDVKGFWIDRN